MRRCWRSSRRARWPSGNTLYLNLEPCSHTGRTGPCADAVIAAGIARVVCCMEDPNPLVAGKGFEKLRAAGIEVEVGILEKEAKRLNESFAQFIRTGLPFVTLKAAMSLDGKIAGPAEPRLQLVGAPSSNPSYITGEAARRRVHEMRHASDAILVGVGTVIADDPLLTDRSGLPRRRPLLRVILDSRLRLPLTSRVVETAQDDVVVFCSFAEENKRRALEARGVRVAAGGNRSRSSWERSTPARGAPRPLSRARTAWSRADHQPAGGGRSGCQLGLPACLSGRQTRAFLHPANLWSGRRCTLASRGEQPAPGRKPMLLPDYD